MSKRNTEEETTATEAASVQEALPPSPVDEAVDAWFVQTFYNLGGELPTPLFNRFNLAKDDLKRRLQALNR